jgi:cation:H+ antiporter
VRSLSLIAALLAETSLQAGSPLAVLWTGPGIVLASLMIAWGAEATQFFLAQGIALAVLALLQTLPEFAVEAVLAWHREVPFLLANLTGALMLLTGLGWPMIYFAASTAYRREHRRPMRKIVLEPEHAVQILSLFAAIAYQLVIWWKGTLTVFDGAALLAIYAVYLLVMRRLPPEECETIDEIPRIPRAIVKARRPLRIAAILGLFLVGGVMVFTVAEPFLAGLFGLATLLGIPSFTFIQWIAPLVSEAPEGVSAFYWARNHERASIALMNLVSSNISQWTLLAALLPAVLSISMGHVAGIPLDAQQSRELILALSQSLLGAFFLVNMEVAWWEAAGLFVLFAAQFISADLHRYITWIYLGWSAVEALRLLAGARKAHALAHFRRIMKRG